MKKKLVVIATAVVLGISMVVPAIAYAGGDQNQEQIQRPIDDPQWQNSGDEPNYYQYEK